MQRRAFILSTAGTILLPVIAEATAVPDIPYVDDLIKAQIAASALLLRAHQQMTDHDALSDFDGFYDDLILAVRQFIEPLAWDIEHNQIRLDKWKNEFKNVQTALDAFNAATRTARRQATASGSATVTAVRTGSGGTGGKIAFTVDVGQTIKMGVDWFNTRTQQKLDQLTRDNSEREKYVTDLRNQEKLWVDSKTLLASAAQPAPSPKH